VRVYVVRHCRLRVEALVANREISWLGAERVADIRRSRRAIRDILVTILNEGVQRGVFDPPQIDGRHDLKAMAMAMLDQCTTSRCGTVRAAPSAKSRWPSSMPTWRCARWAPSRSKYRNEDNGWQMTTGFRALLVVSLLIAACTPEQAAAPPPSARTSQQMAMLSDGVVPADRWRVVLIAGDNNSPAFDNGVEAMRAKLVARGVRDIRALTSDPGANPSLPSLPRRTYRAPCAPPAARPALPSSPATATRAASC
jgi:hypothetical protein